MGDVYSPKCDHCRGVGYVLEELWGGSCQVVPCHHCHGSGMKAWQQYDQRPFPRIENA